jgi:hypothetical protein
MGAIERLASNAATRRLGVRAYVVRALTRRETSRAIDRTVADLARATDGRDRALGAFARIVLGDADADRWLGDPDAAVRRAAAMATLQCGTRATHAALLARRAHEEDAATRTVLGAGLVDGDPGGELPTGALASCARGGGADVPLCTLALARRASEAAGATPESFLASRDAIVRAHAVRGLAGSEDPARGGRLAAAFAYEPDPLVRRAIVTAFATVPRDAPGIADTIAIAARLDPDPEIRWIAAHLDSPRRVPASSSGSTDETDIAWIHLTDLNGAPPASGSGPAACQTGALLRPDGIAIPIAFDADGDALVPRVPIGSSRLVLAPRMDAAYAPSP